MWSKLNRPELGAAEAISNAIGDGADASPEVIAKLRAAGRLLAFSDTGGDHDAATHRAHSFLIVTPGSVARWIDVWKPSRARLLGDRRRMSYTRLGDRRRRAALAPFLDGTAALEGFIVTVLIDKSLQVFEREPVPIEFARWKRGSFTRLLAQTHLISILLSGLTAAGADVLWISDEDEIASNEQRMWEVCDAVGRIGSHYLSHNLGHFRFATAKSDDGSRQLEDLLAIADLSAGCLSDLKSSYRRIGAELSTALILPPPATLSTKTRLLLNWVVTPRGPRHVVVALDDNSPTSRFRASLLVFHSA